MITNVLVYQSQNNNTLYVFSPQALPTLFHVHPVFFIIIFKGGQKNICQYSNETICRRSFRLCACVCSHKENRCSTKEKALLNCVCEHSYLAHLMHTSSFVKRDRPDDIFILFYILFFFFRFFSICLFWCIKSVFCVPTNLHIKRVYVLLLVLLYTHLWKCMFVYLQKCFYSFNLKTTIADCRKIEFFMIAFDARETCTCVYYMWFHGSGLLWRVFVSMTVFDC